MKNLQMKYNLLHIFYWITSCTIYGYVAVFLQYKGLSNTEIGIVSGAGAILSIFISPFMSSIVSQVKGLSIKKLILILYCVMYLSFIVLSLFSLPTICIMVLYVSLICFIVSIVPFLSTICMDYLKAGQYINFGLSRGMGSVSYAVSAVVLGQLIELFDPRVLSIVFIFSSLLLLVLLFSMPECEKKETVQIQNEASVLTIIHNYRTFFLILLAFAFVFAASSTLSTYLINIVHQLGGSTSIYGVAVFAMAASEMPVMAVTHSLLKKYKSETLLLISAFCYVLRNFTICLAPNVAVLIVGMMFQSVSYGLFTATITYYVNDYLKTEDQMMGQTMIGMMSSGVGATIGNVSGGILQDTLGLNSMLVFVCCLTVIGAMIMTFTLKNKIGWVKKRRA